MRNIHLILFFIVIGCSGNNELANRPLVGPNYLEDGIDQQQDLETASGTNSDEEIDIVQYGRGSQGDIALGKFCVCGSRNIGEDEGDSSIIRDMLDNGCGSFL